MPGPWGGGAGVSRTPRLKGPGSRPGPAWTSEPEHRRPGSPRGAGAGPWLAARWATARRGRRRVLLVPLNFRAPTPAALGLRCPDCPPPRSRFIRRQLEPPREAIIIIINYRDPRCIMDDCSDNWHPYQLLPAPARPLECRAGTGHSQSGGRVRSAPGQAAGGASEGSRSQARPPETPHPRPCLFLLRVPSLFLLLPTPRAPWSLFLRRMFSRLK